MNKKKDTFTESEKLQIYQRDKGICQICLKYVDLTQAHYHHRKPVYDGGDVHDIKNGVLTHDQCHTRYFEELHGRKFINIRLLYSRKAKKAWIYGRHRQKNPEEVERATKIELG